MVNVKGMTHKEIELFKGFKTKAKDRQLTSMIRGLMDEIARREDIIPDDLCPSCQEPLKEKICTVCGYPCAQEEVEK